MTKYRAQQDVTISGFECGTEIEMSMVVTYDMSEHFPASYCGPEEFPAPESVNVRFFRKRDKVNVSVVIPGWIEAAFTDSDAFNNWLTSEAEEADICAAEDAADHKREILRDEGKL